MAAATQYADGQRTDKVCVGVDMGKLDVKYGSRARSLLLSTAANSRSGIREYNPRDPSSAYATSSRKREIRIRMSHSHQRIAPGPLLLYYQFFFANVVETRYFKLAVTMELNKTREKTTNMFNKGVVHVGVRGFDIRTEEKSVQRVITAKREPVSEFPRV